MKELGLDPKKVLWDDFADFSGLPDEMSQELNDSLYQKGTNSDRFNIIRIHVFDTEISDSNGNLQNNEHLDVLDKLIAACNEKKTYLWLTPIAWWSCLESIDSFSTQTPMPAMIFDEKVRQIQINYLRQFLTHINPYTNRRLIDEPCLVLFELINEPIYWRYNEMSHFEESSDQWLASWKNRIKADWLQGLPSEDWMSEDSWNYYVYQRTRSYIDELYQVYRELGAKQPIGYHAGCWATPPSVYQAIADSQAEAITVNFYLSLQQKPVADEYCSLNRTFNVGFPKILAQKARLVYEFDASDTLKQVDLYPALARYWRELGVQVACQFQYDSLYTADINRPWPTHYLNFRHTPQRIASFLIGGEIFRTFPRGTQLSAIDTESLIFPPAATSWLNNVALFSDSEHYMQTSLTDWKPLSVFENPEQIIAVDSTPFYDYEGTGLVLFSSHQNQAILRIFPNVISLRTDVLVGSESEPLTKLSEEPRLFQMKMEKWRQADLERWNGSEWIQLNDQPARFMAIPGLYRFSIKK